MIFYQTSNTVYKLPLQEFRATHLLDVSPDLQATQEDDSLLGLLDLLHLIGNDQGELGDAVDDMALGLDQSGHSGGGDGRHQGVATLVDIHLAVPATEGLGGGEHASTTAHVAEGSLAGTVGTTTTDTGNTGHSTSSSPGFGGGLVTYGNAKKNRIRLTAWRCYVQITHQPAR